MQDIDPITDRAYTDLVLPPWPFWRACMAVGLPILLLMLPVSEVRLTSNSSACRFTFRLYIAGNPSHAPAALLFTGSHPKLMQGDNREDAMRLASHTLEVLDTTSGPDAKLVEIPARWVVPPSWVVFGQQRAVY